jgi:hypothetical protein
LLEDSPVPTSGSERNGVVGCPNRVGEVACVEPVARTVVDSGVRDDPQESAEYEIGDTERLVGVERVA